MKRIISDVIKWIKDLINKKINKLFLIIQIIEWINRATTFLAKFNRFYLIFTTFQNN